MGMGQKKLREKVTSIFSFSHNIFKSLLFHVHEKSALCSKGLTLSQMTILDSSKLKEITDDNFELDENSRKFPKQKTLWEKEKLLVTSNFSFCTADT